MMLKDFYTSGFADKVYSKLQQEREGVDKGLRTYVGEPESVTMDFAGDWLRFNYLFALDNKEDGSPMMGQIGGVIGYIDKRTRMVAVSEASIAKVRYGFNEIVRAERENDESIVSALEERIEMPLEYRNGLTIVNGNRNVAHYDFTTAAAYTDISDILSTDIYLLLSAAGYKVISYKQLPDEAYIFNIPFRQDISDEFGKIHINTVETEDYFIDRVAILNSSKDIVPAGFTPGFHIIYDGSAVTVKPLVIDSDLQELSGWLKKEGLTVTDSGLNQIGFSDAYGRPIGLFDTGIFR